MIQQYFLKDEFILLLEVASPKLVKFNYHSKNAYPTYNTRNLQKGMDSFLLMVSLCTTNEAVWTKKVTLENAFSLMQNNQLTVFRTWRPIIRFIA